MSLVKESQGLMGALVEVFLPGAGGPIAEEDTAAKWPLKMGTAHPVNQEKGTVAPLLGGGDLREAGGWPAACSERTHAPDDIKTRYVEAVVIAFEVATATAGEADRSFASDFRCDQLVEQT